MLKTLELLKTSKIISSYNILDFKSGDTFYYIKASINLTDNSILHIREFISDTEYNYSYYWQNTKGKLLIRWDNAPHHKEISTYPHHKHTEKIEESEEVDLEKVLEYIIRLLK